MCDFFSGLHSFRWEIYCYVNWCSLTDNVSFVSGCCQHFFLLLLFSKLNYEMCWCVSLGLSLLVSCSLESLNH